MNNYALPASQRSPFRLPGLLTSDTLALPKALLSVLVIMGGYITVGTALALLTSGVTVGGYSVAWSVFTSLILMAAVILWVKKTRGSLASLGFKRPQSYPRAILLALAGTVAVFAFAFIPVSTLAHFGYLPPVTYGETPLLVFGPSLSLSLVLSIVLMWPHAALGEEVLFRGFLQGNVERALGGESWRTGLIAVVVVAFSFGLLHMPAQGPTGLLQTGLAGVVLGVVYLIAKRNLFTVVLTHGLVNTTAYLFMASAVSA